MLFGKMAVSGHTDSVLDAESVMKRLESAISNEMKDLENVEKRKSSSCGLLSAQFQIQSDQVF